MNLMSARYAARSLYSRESSSTRKNAAKTFYNGRLCNFVSWVQQVLEHNEREIAGELDKTDAGSYFS